MVTSNPKRISVAAGVVHIIVLLLINRLDHYLVRVSHYRLSVKKHAI